MNDYQKSKNISGMTAMVSAVDTVEGVIQIYQQYRFAREYCADKTVLEIGCSIGRGIGYLARIASSVTGVDINRDAINYAKAYYSDRDNIEICFGDGHNLPFPDASFDVILIFQAIYLFENAEILLNECKRLLKKDGKLLISTINKKRCDFKPCKYSVKYHSDEELINVLKDFGFETTLYAALPEDLTSFKKQIVYYIKVIASKCKLIPSSYRLKALLKRIFYGKLKNLPNELKDGDLEYIGPVKMSVEDDKTRYQILYTVSSKN